MPPEFLKIIILNMQNINIMIRCHLILILLSVSMIIKPVFSWAQQPKVIAFPGAEGFGKFAAGARGVATPTVYVVTNLSDSGPGSFRDAVSRPGRFVVFSISGIIHLKSNLTVASNTTVAGQTAPGSGIVLYGRKVSFTGADNSIIRHIRIRLGSQEGVSRNDDASGIANGKNIIFDHVSFSWGQDEVFSINWDRRGREPDSITLQNCIIAQGLHINNHSAGGLIQTKSGHISIIKCLYGSNKTRNPKVKGFNEFVNNVVYNWGNAGNKYGHHVSGEGYIMGGSEGVSKVNIINNYFIAGPATPDRPSPFSRGTGTFYLFASGNMYDSNKDGMLNGEMVPVNETGYPGLSDSNFVKGPFQYPYLDPLLSADRAFEFVLNHAGATLPARDEVDELLIRELKSLGKEGRLVFREIDTGLANGGLGRYKTAKPLTDTDGDGIPDRVEKAMGLNPKDASDATQFNRANPGYLNIEVYFNSIGH